jgi:hypothetical protein
MVSGGSWSSPSAEAAPTRKAVKAVARGKEEEEEEEADVEGGWAHEPPASTQQQEKEEKEEEEEGDDEAGPKNPRRIGIIEMGWVGVGKHVS